MTRRAAIWAGVLLALMLAGALTGTAAVAASGGGAESHGGRPHPTSTAMPGMDHGNTDMPGMSDMPGMEGDGNGDMPGMEHGDGGDMPGMGHSHVSDPAPDRPLGLVLSSFGAGSTAVLAAAAVLRRRDRAARSAKQALRDAREATS